MQEMEKKFKALMLEQEDGELRAEIRQLSLQDLPAQGVMVRVHYSSLNYKDALAITGKGKVVRNFPMIPGIDLAGVVVEPADSQFNVGDEVVCTGWGVGEEHWGGLSQYAKLDAGWPLPVPQGMDMRSTMVMGTAGLTAAFCTLAIQEHGIRPQDGPVLVSGAGGGVGGVSIVLLARLGYEVHAISGREDLHPYLHRLGAAEVHHRQEFSRESKPLEKACWAAAVDTVGGDTLATLLSQVQPDGIVAACGNAGGMQLNTTVFPFILRGITLQGISSVHAAMSRRQRAWQLIAKNIPSEYYAYLTDHEITLNEVLKTSEELLKGRIQGRIIVNMQS